MCCDRTVLELRSWTVTQVKYRMFLYVKKESRTKWKKYVIKNLSADEKEIKNLKKCQSSGIIGLLRNCIILDSRSKIRPSNPMQFFDIVEISHTVENIFFINRNDINYFHNVPNYPIDLVRNDGTPSGTAKNLKECREALINQIQEREKNHPRKKVNN